MAKKEVKANNKKAEKEISKELNEKLSEGINTQLSIDTDGVDAEAENAEEKSNAKMRMELADELANRKEKPKANNKYEKKDYIKEIKLEIEKMKAMDKKKRMDYFKSYYLKTVLFILFLLVCLGWFLYDGFFSRHNTVFTGGLVACQISEEGRLYLTDEFLEFVDGIPGEDEILLVDDLWIAFSEEDVEQHLSMDPAIAANLAAGDFNYLLIDGAMIEQYGNMNAFASVDYYAEIMELSDEDVFYTRDGDMVAIKLPDYAIDKCGLEPVTDSIYIAFVDVNRDMGMEDRLLNYIFYKAEE